MSRPLAFTDAELLEALASDRTIAEIASDLGVVLWTVYKRASRAGYSFHNERRPGRLRNMTDAQRAIYRTFMNNKYSVDESLLAVGAI